MGKGRGEQGYTRRTPKQCKWQNEKLRPNLYIKLKRSKMKSSSAMATSASTEIDFLGNGCIASKQIWWLNTFTSKSISKELRSWKKWICNFCWNDNLELRRSCKFFHVWNMFVMSNYFNNLLKLCKTKPGSNGGRRS